MVDPRRARRAVSVCAALALVSAGAPAAAQLRPVSLGLAGGATMPSGDLEGSLERGYHGLATVRVGLPVLPVHLRADAMHGQLGAKSATGSDFRVTSVSGNLGYDVAPLGPVALYAIGGAGYYWMDDAASGDRTRHTGWNAGAGVRVSLGALRLFAEARYHATRSSSGEVRFIPVTVGILF